MQETVGRRVARPRVGAVVAAGDLLVVAVVLGAGMLRHGVNPLVSTTHAALVIGPFALGWLVAAPAVGAYTADAYRAPRAAVRTVVGGWLGAVLIGGVLRATPFLPGNSPPVFLAVVFGSGLGGLAAWRAAVGFSLGLRG